MASATEEINGDVDMEVVGEDSDEVDGEVLDEKKQNFITQLVSAGYTETRAKRALQFVDSEDVIAGKSVLKRTIDIC